MSPVFPFRQFYNIGIPYYEKIYFDRFKKRDQEKCQNNSYMTIVSKRMPSDEEIEKYILPLIEEKDKLLITYSRHFNMPSKFYSHPKFKYFENHIDNFFSSFNEYIYFHCGYIDPHPRLFHENIFYNKKSNYINNLEIFDGGFYRHQDSVEYNLYNHCLNPSDEVVSSIQSKNQSSAVVHCYLPHINGGILDAFEYFYCILDSGIDAYLYLLQNSYNRSVMSKDDYLRMFFTMLHDRYDITDECVKRIKIVPHNIALLTNEFKVPNILILDNHTFKEIKLFHKKFENIYMIVDPFIPSITKYDDLIEFSHIHIYNEIEMWRKVYKDD